MLGRAVTAALPEGFAADVERTFNALSEEWDENTWNAKTAEYVATLERAGFRLAAETAPPESEKKKPLRRFVRFDDDEADEKKAVAPLSRGELNGVDVVRGVATRFNRGVDADTTAITYSKETGTLKAEVPFGSGGFWNRRLDLELPMSETDHSAYVAAKEAADAAVTEEERELAETTEALAALERQQKERVAKSNIADIIKLPMRMLERDATRRAYQWMRKLKQEAGVDLFAAHMAHAETTLPGIREARKSTVENCESSTEEALEPGNESLVETDVIENLDIGLQSYGAEHPPLKKRGS
jgi:peroxiredoxin family protein